MKRYPGAIKVEMGVVRSGYLYPLANWVLKLALAEKYQLLMVSLRYPSVLLSRIASSVFRHWRPSCAFQPKRISRLLSHWKYLNL